MKFSLLGVDAEVLAIVQEWVTRQQLDLVAVYEAGEFAADLHALAPQAKIGGEWETLLTGGIDFVLVGRRVENNDMRADQLRKLVQEAVPLILVHPACEYIIGYELEMIRADVKGVILPYYPGMFRAEFRSESETSEHAQASAPATLGKIEQLVFQRRMASRTRSAVRDQLARDAALIRQVLGNIRQVGAQGTLDDSKGPINLGVQLTSESGVLARWSVEPAKGRDDAVCTLIGAHGDRAIDLPAVVDDSADLLAYVQRALERQQQHGPAWLDACRATEIADTVPRCLARGKTIDLYNEEHTEDGAFKGTMAVGGCLIIMLGLFALVIVALVEGLQLPIRDYFFWRIWPVYLLAPIVVFLFLQVLGMLARSAPPRKP